MWVGELYGFVFENSGAGVPLGLYWSLYLRSEQSDERVVVDFFSLKVNDCVGFAQAPAVVDAGDEIAAISYYRDGHCPAESCDLRLTRESGQRFKVRVSLHDVVGCECTELDVDAVVVFSGFIVRGDSLDRPVLDADAARAVLAQFMDPSRIILASENPYLFVPIASS